MRVKGGAVVWQRIQAEKESHLLFPFACAFRSCGVQFKCVVSAWFLELPQVTAVWGRSTHFVALLGLRGLLVGLVFPEHLPQELTHSAYPFSKHELNASSLAW